MKEHPQSEWLNPGPPPTRAACVPDSSVYRPVLAFQYTCESKGCRYPGNRLLEFGFFIEPPVARFDHRGSEKSQKKQRNRQTSAGRNQSGIDKPRLVLHIFEPGLVRSIHRRTASRKRKNREHTSAGPRVISKFHSE
ncbi:hypothetical protein C8R45DRAFT_937160 [Mycena sanguinolenta]|nr:hypothetical protein C8R45DRAFT_937160 [Mycena sanguinolenta]